MTKAVGYDQALSDSIEYFNGDELAAQVFLGKYALTDTDGNIVESNPDEMHKRLAHEFARIESKYDNPLNEEQIYSYLKDFKYIVPQGSPMAGIGNPYQLMSISNCFVIESPNDSYASILRTDQEEAQIMKRRGGVGFDISNIRPRGETTSNAAKTTDGIGVFMERFSNTCREVAQGGRRGALMLTISVHHPEIETFIDIKKDLKRVTGANISIKLTDEFMKAVQSNSDFELRWPVDSSDPKISRTVNAQELWTKIIEAAHGFAEPGLLFWDTVQRRTPADCYPGFESISTNPCGEIVLSAYDSCRLLVVNTVSYVNNPFTSKAYFDFDLFIHHVMIAQRLMDDIIDLEIECIDKILNKIDSDPEPDEEKFYEMRLWHKIKNACINGRRTGTGVTSIGDAIAALNLNYASDEGIAMIENVYKSLALGAYKSTVQLAKERGTFPAYDFDLEKNHEFINQVMDLDVDLKNDWIKYGRRNIALTTTAPAGSVSVQTQTTSGIEPAYLLSYTRRKKINPNDLDARVDFVDDLGDKWQEFPVYHHWYKKWMDITGKTDPAESPYFNATSRDINWVGKVKAQAAAQKWICHAISNTTNIPEDTSTDVVKDIYMTGWLSGCKGVTVYREGSRSGVLISNEQKDTEKKPIFQDHHAPKRPIELSTHVHTMTVQGEKWTFFVGLLNDRPYEIMGGLSKFINIPKRVTSGTIIKHNTPQSTYARYDFHYDQDRGEDHAVVVKDITTIFENATHAAFTRTLSLALRHGAPVQYVVEQLIKGAEKEDDLFSFSKAASRVLKVYIENGTKTNKHCPSCNSSQLAYQEGCVTCQSCGNSKCS